MKLKVELPLPKPSREGQNQELAGFSEVWLMETDVLLGWIEKNRRKADSGVFARRE